ncbi:MAG: zinc transporter ZntB [Pseudomonadota bacterium]
MAAILFHEAVAAPGHAGWTHFDGTSRDVETALTDVLEGLDPVVGEALLAAETRPRVTPIGDGAIVILRGVNLNADADPEDMVSLRIWIDAERIVSVQLRQLRAVQDTRDRLVRTGGTSGAVLATLVQCLAERMEATLGALDDAALSVEERVIAEDARDLRRQIVEMRRRAILLRRFLAPQREAISALQNAGLSWIIQSDRRSLNETGDRLLRYVEDLDAVRDRLQVVKDELANLQAERLNRNLYLLAIISAIFLPLGFLTGLLGVNVGGIPGTESAGAFWLVSGGLALLAVGQVVLLRWLRWF